MKPSIAAALAMLAAARGTAGEIRPLAVEERFVPRPGSPPLEGPLPRPLFLAEVIQKNPGEKTVYFVLDPLRPGDGLRKVYEGPGDQYCRFLTPLLGGVGVVIGEVDPARNESGRRLFWFDLLRGKPGETIAVEPWDEWTAGRELRFRASGRMHRLDPAAGSLRSFAVDLRLAERIGGSTLLGVSPLGGRLHAVLVDVARETLEDLGELPGPLQAADDFDHIFPAGPRARDGLAYVRDGDFALWYKPPGSRWLRVLRSVHIFKNFGGMPPSLPVAYLGDRRFAVARTVKDEVPGRIVGKEPTSAPDSLSVSMLVDGMTGRILEETKPVAYSGNPGLDIPEGWWSEEAREARRRRAAKPAAPRPFLGEIDEKVWSTAGGKTVEVAAGEEARLSADGRWLAIFDRAWVEDGPPAKIRFRLIDGSTGEERSLEISLPSREGLVHHAAWQVLASGSSRAEDMEGFLPARPDPFLDPW
jgi:hypothetical protein